MKHGFLDVEALRLTKPWIAPLMQVAVVVFNETGMVYPQEGGNWYVHPDSLPDWVVPDEETELFWKQQEGWPKMEENRWNGDTIELVLKELAEALKDCDTVWFSGPTYDQVMIESYFDFYKIPRPWKYNNTRDFRTIRKQHPDIEYKYPEGDHLHDAWYDCHYSIAHLSKISTARGLIWL